MKTPVSVAWLCMRRRSPKIAPPEKGLEGSTASTPTFSPRPLNWVINLSTKSDLPPARRSGDAMNRARPP